MSETKLDSVVRRIVNGRNLLALLISFFLVLGGITVIDSSTPCELGIALLNTSIVVLGSIQLFARYLPSESKLRVAVSSRGANLAFAVLAVLYLTVMTMTHPLMAKTMPIGALVIASTMLVLVLAMGFAHYMRRWQEKQGR